MLINNLDLLLMICSPLLKLTITHIGIDLTERKLKLLSNLKVNEINFESSNVTTSLLDQVDSLPHSRKFVTGNFSHSEDWSNLKYEAYRHLFRTGQGPVIR